MGSMCEVIATSNGFYKGLATKSNTYRGLLAVVGGGWVAKGWPFQTLCPLVAGGGSTIGAAW